MTARPRTMWRCRECGYGASRWMGRCPDCGEFGTFSEDVSPEGPSPRRTTASAAVPLRLSELPADEGERIPTGIDEFDRVLGGGLVRGSLVLLAGEPGIGKSTLLLQAVDALACRGLSVMYVCGEESPAQVRLRAARIHVASEDLLMLPEVDVSVVEATVLDVQPDILVVDSVQTLFDPDLTSAPGSVSQVRAGTARLMRLAKDRGVTVIVVGHVTKEGAIAGPRVLEHMVDTVLYFEGDRDGTLRVVRAVKNRFGSVSEIGLFEMTAEGLVTVGSPSEALISKRDGAVPGSVIMAAMEGSRSLLVEIQALVSPSCLDMPRRLATGIDRNRALQVIAVLERLGDVSFGKHDVYVSVVGGVRVAEPAADLPLALALASARTGTPLPAGLVAMGEIGLTGEIRPAAGLDLRLAETGRMGLSAVVIGGSVTGKEPDGLQLTRVGTIGEALEKLF